MSSRRFLAGLVMVLGLTTALAVDAARRLEPPALVVRYREALRSWFPAASAMSLDAVDLTGTAGARPTAIAFTAVDHAVRRFAPMAVDASGKAPPSVRLRRLGAITDTASAQAARTSIALTVAALQSSATMSRQPRIEAAMTALRAAERAVVYAAQLGEACAAPRRGRLAAHTVETCAAIADGAVTESSQVAALALAAGADPPVLVEACLQSLRDMSRIPRAAR